MSGSNGRKCAGKSPGTTVDVVGTRPLRWVTGMAQAPPAAMTGALVNILSVGGRRLHISVRFERVAEAPGLKAERAYLAREARNALLDEYSRREIERYTTVSGLH